jgi:nitronate monooxygenase
MALIPAIVRATSRPVIAAGAIADGASMHAAFSLGALAVQIGTPFIASHESLAGSAWKKAVQEAADTDIILTNAFSGRWARGVRNKLIDKVKNSKLRIPSYPVQNSLTTPIRVKAQQQNNTDYIAMWRGQSPVKIEAKSSAEIFLNLVKQAEEFAL